MHDTADMFGVIHKHLVRVRTNRWVVMCEASVSFSDKELTRKYKRLHALCVDEMELETLLAHHELTDKLSDFECFCIADDLAFLDFDECEGNGRFEKMDISRKNLIRGINATAKKLWNIKV